MSRPFTYARMYSEIAQSVFTAAGMLVIPLIVFLLGMMMLISPITFVKMGAWMSGGRDKIRWNDPEEVSRSFSMRLNYRIAGVFAVLIGLIQSYNEILNLLNRR
jgi:hypothetical protein